MKKSIKHASVIFTISIFLFCAENFRIFAQSCTSVPAGLVAWWRAEGNANDSSGNGLNGTLGLTTFDIGKVGQAFKFNDVFPTNGVQVANNAALNPQSLTIEGWFASTGRAEPECIVCRSDAVHDFGYDLVITQGDNPAFSLGVLRLILRIGNSSVSGDLVDTGHRVVDGGFHHVAATYDGATMKIYLDGTLDAQLPYSGGIVYTIDPFFIGGDGTNRFVEPFNGLIDEVSFYNRALSAAEIQAIFNAGTAGKCFSPTAASVTIGGRIINASGRGIANARVQLTEADGTVRTVSTGAFGHYRFADVLAGQTVTLIVFSKRFKFANSVRVMNVAEEITDANFVAAP